MRMLANRLLQKVVLVFVLATFATQTIRFYMRSGLPKPWAFGDFDVFHLAGGMALRGEYPLAYAAQNFQPVQKAFSGGPMFLPWTYPPQFGLVVAPLASMNVTLSYVLFVTATVGLYLYVLHKLVGSQSRVVLALIFPTLVMTILCGQNGFLTAAIIGLSCLLMLRQSAYAGATLGLMTIKPHLAVTLAVYTFLTRQWRVVATAAATVAATSLAATLAFGAEVWTSFISGISEAGEFLTQAAYPMHRMVSIYATMRSVGASAGAAFAIQIIFSIAAIAMVAVIALKKTPMRTALGLFVFLGLFISPYAYDYDLPILGVAIALLLPDLVRRMTLGDEALMLVLAWGATFWGFGIQRYYQYVGIELDPDYIALSFGGVFLALLFVQVWRIVQREPISAVQGSRSSAAASPA